VICEGGKYLKRGVLTLGAGVEARGEQARHLANKEMKKGVYGKVLLVKGPKTFFPVKGKG